MFRIAKWPNPHLLAKFWYYPSASIEPSGGIGYFRQLTQIPAFRCGILFGSESRIPPGVPEPINFPV